MPSTHIDIFRSPILASFVVVCVHFKSIAHSSRLCYSPSTFRLFIDRSPNSPQDGINNFNSTNNRKSFIFCSTILSSLLLCSLFLMENGRKLRSYFQLFTLLLLVSTRVWRKGGGRRWKRMKVLWNCQLLGGSLGMLTSCWILWMRFERRKVFKKSTRLADFT